MNALKRCAWPGEDPQYLSYHDTEWGVPVYDDGKLFEFLTLEAFQAGLSWITILRKRAHFREAFDRFDYRKIAAYNENKVQELLNNAGIIRNRLKITATISNAQSFMRVQDEFGSFSRYMWGFVQGKPIQNAWKQMNEIPASTEMSDRISADMKKRGFKFVGTTIVYAHMQATGMVNDHIVDCFRHSEVQERANE